MIQTFNRPLKFSAIQTAKNIFALVSKVVFLMTGLDCATVAAADRVSSLCHQDEQAIFNCAVAGSGKLISLCAAQTLDTRRGYLQYRFGKPGAIELQFPQERANTQRVFRYAHYFRAQVDRSEITFDNQDYRYVIFDYFEGDVKPAIKQAGVRVSRHGADGKEMQLICAGISTSNLGRLEPVIPRDNDNPLNQ